MVRILYIIAVVLIIAWAISFLGGLVTGGIIHTLLIIAVIILLYTIITGNKKA